MTKDDLALKRAQWAAEMAAERARWDEYTRLLREQFAGGKELSRPDSIRPI